MHIAVCMDVAADRKQLERLLGRSADRRLAADPTVPYYVQSYGNKEALLARPFMYDLFFIDLINDDLDSVELARRLRDLGVTATIALVPGKVDLTDRIVPEDRVLILKQPVREKDLEEILDAACAAVADKTPRLDIRGADNTVHVREEDFYYAERAGDMMINVHLKDGSVITCSESIENFGMRCTKFSDIMFLPKDLVVHKQYIMSTGFGKVVLRDNAKFHVSNKRIKQIEALIRA